MDIKEQEEMDKRINGQNQTAGTPGQAVIPETEETKRLKENFWPIAPWALAYSVFYAFCM